MARVPKILENAQNVIRAHLVGGAAWPDAEKAFRADAAQVDQEEVKDMRTSLGLVAEWEHKIGEPKYGEVRRCPCCGHVPAIAYRLSVFHGSMQPNNSYVGSLYASTACDKCEGPITYTGEDAIEVSYRRTTKEEADAAVAFTKTEVGTREEMMAVLDFNLALAHGCAKRGEPFTRLFHLSDLKNGEWPEQGRQKWKAEGKTPSRPREKSAPGTRAAPTKRMRSDASSATTGPAPKRVQAPPPPPPPMARTRPSFLDGPVVKLRGYDPYTPFYEGHTRDM
ncbi:hypothetical protein GGF32_007812, partial [Allomyces javanicus]